MGQLRRRDHVPDGVNVRDAGLAVLVDGQASPLGGQADFLEVEAGGVGRPAHGQEHLLRDDLLHLAGGVFDRQRRPVGTRLHALHRRLQEVGDLAFLEGLLQLLGDFLILERQQVREHLDEGDLAAEVGIDGGELHPHRARADHGQGLGRLGQPEHVGAGEDPLAVEADVREGLGLGARGDHDEPAAQRLRRLAVLFHGHGVLVDEAAHSRKRSHAVFLEQETDALGQGGDDAVLALVHPAHVERKPSTTTPWSAALPIRA